MGLKETGWESMNWIELAQERGKWQTLVNKVMNLWGGQYAGTFLSR
jgi:hypothetical protein